MDEALKRTRSFSFVLDYIWGSISNKDQVDHIISEMPGDDALKLLTVLWDTSEITWHLTSSKNNINKDIRYLYVIRKLICRLDQEDSRLTVFEPVVDRLRRQKW